MERHTIAFHIGADVGYMVNLYRCSVCNGYSLSAETLSHSSSLDSDIFCGLFSSTSFTPSYPQTSVFIFLVARHGRTCFPLLFAVKCPCSSSFCRLQKKVFSDALPWFISACTSCLFLQYQLRIVTQLDLL